MLAALLPHLALAQAVAPGPTTVPNNTAAPLGLAGLPPTVPEISLPAVTITGTAPLLGSGGDANKVPASSNALTRQDVVRTGIPSVLDALNEKVGGVALDEASGNPFQPNLLYRGFTASPLAGSAQGIAVYLNGTRFNQPFGDTVDWDLIPPEAIAQVNLGGANPVFGLNALGGSLSVQLHDGFSFHGGDIRFYGGSFGRIGADFQYGRQSGNTAAFLAGSVIHANGWRQDQGSEIHRIYGDIGWRGRDATLDFGLLAADNRLAGPGTTPVELLAVDRGAQFTGPDVTVNRYVRASLTGTYDMGADTQLQGAAYYTNLSQRVLSGNAANTEPCDADRRFVCINDGPPLLDRAGNRVPNFIVPSNFPAFRAFRRGGPYGELDRQGVDTNGYGASAQVTNSTPLFGFGNRVIAGASFDGGISRYTASSQLGGLTLDRFFAGPGIPFSVADLSIAPVRLSATNSFYGFYASDTLDLTSQLSLTLAGRLNVAGIDLRDQLGTGLSGNHVYARLNPAVGLTYALAPWLTAYAGYSEANRAPSPVELACADPAQPCTIANFFVSDPDLKQIVAHTWEAGLRGTAHPAPEADLLWHAGLFRTESSDDIAFVPSPAVPSRDYFANVGGTRRQGLEAGIAFRARRLDAWVDYAYTEATFQTALTVDSELNPAADENGQIRIRPGNRLPGVPLHRLKFGTEYGITEAWTVGLAGIASSGRFLFGDEANLTRPTKPYVVLNLNTRYRLTPNIELFGLVENPTNTRYETYGTFSPVALVPIVQVPGASNTRSLSPAAPVAGYGGVHVTF